MGAPDFFSVEYGETRDLPVLAVGIATQESWFQYGYSACPVIVSEDPVWTVNNTSIAEITGSQLNGKKAGRTTLNGALFGKTVSITLIVNQVPLNEAEITLSQLQAVYTGNAITPGISGIVVRGRTLGTSDYSLSYSSNIKHLFHI